MAVQEMQAIVVEGKTVIVVGESRDPSRTNESPVASNVETNEGVVEPVMKDTGLEPITRDRVVSDGGDSAKENNNVGVKDVGTKSAKGVEPWAEAKDVQGLVQGDARAGLLELNHAHASTTECSTLCRMNVEDNLVFDDEEEPEMEMVVPLLEYRDGHSPRDAELAILGEPPDARHPA